MFTVTNTNKTNLMSCKNQHVLLRHIGCWLSQLLNISLTSTYTQ